MHLTKHTDYAFRVLIHLASMPPGRHATIKDIAERFAISRSHLMKIVNRLAAAGVLAASRGQHGGIRLAVAPEAVNLRQVVELMEATLAPVNCEAPACIISRSCRLKTILFDAQQQFLDHVGQYTLADLITPATALVRLLHPARQA